MQMGLCVPVECSKEDLKIMDKIYMSGSKLSGSIEDPSFPEYSFPKDDYDLIEKSKGSVGFISMILILVFFFCLSILGYIVETRKLGDK